MVILEVEFKFSRLLVSFLFFEKGQRKKSSVNKRDEVEIASPKLGKNLEELKKFSSLVKRQLVAVE